MASYTGCARIDDPSPQCLAAIGSGIAIIVFFFCFGIFYCVYGGEVIKYRILICCGIETEETYREKHVPRAATAEEAADDYEASIDRCQICINRCCGTEEIQGKNHGIASVAPLSPSEELAAAQAEVDGEYQRAENIITRHVSVRRVSQPLAGSTKDIPTEQSAKHILELTGEVSSVEHHQHQHNPHYNIKHHSNNNNSNNSSRRSSRSNSGSQNYESSHHYQQESLPLPNSDYFHRHTSISHTSSDGNNHPGIAYKYSQGIANHYPPPIYENKSKIEDELPIARPHEHHAYHAWNETKILENSIKNETTSISYNNNNNNNNDPTHHHHRNSESQRHFTSEKHIHDEDMSHSKKHPDHLPPHSSHSNSHSHIPSRRTSVDPDSSSQQYNNKLHHHSSHNPNHEEHHHTVSHGKTSRNNSLTTASSLPPQHHHYPSTHRAELSENGTNIHHKIDKNG